jgi:HEAT repeat protein
MLRREDAQKRLEKFQIKNWEKDRIAALRRLPARLGVVGLGLLGRAADGKAVSHWAAQQKLQEETGRLIGELAPAARQKIFAVLFPKLGRCLENAWQLIARLPYEVDYARKGFRAPNDPATQRSARASWTARVIGELKGYDEAIAWVAAWAPHLGGYGGADAVGILLAAAIDAGGDEGEEVFRILCESARNEHEIGSMGRHVTRGLLVASRPEGWEFIEKLLLAAQRQEGLRQVILETIDEAHPQAFRRMVRLILENKLVRFSSVIRAVDVWFGLAWDAVSTGVVQKSLETVLQFLDEPQAREEVIAKGDPQTVYFALWTLGFEDAVAAVKPAARLLADADVERRFVAAHFLRQLDLPEAKAELVRCLDDEDLRLAVLAAENLPASGHQNLFEQLHRLLERLPAKPIALPALVWPWMALRVNRAGVADLLVDQLGDRPLATLAPYLKQMSWNGRSQMVNKIVEGKKFDDPAREMLLVLLGVTETYVRERILKALKNCSLAESDAVRLEGFLTRKNADLRRAAFTLLKKQKTPAALASADRLLASKHPQQRLGGLELLGQFVESRRAVDECRQRAEQYRNQRSRLSEEEDLQTSVILDVERVVPKLDDALGLMGDMQRSPALAPKARKVAFLTPAAIACLQSLDDLIHQHRQTEITVKTYHGPEQVLLGNATSWLPGPDRHKPAEVDAIRLPLRPLWEEWHQQRPKKERDRDGLELVRAFFAWTQWTEKVWKGMAKRLGKEWSGCLKTLCGGLTPPTLRRPEIVRDILDWLLRLHPPAGAIDYLLDSVETAFALVPSSALNRAVNLKKWDQRSQDWRISSPPQLWEQSLNAYLRVCPDDLTSEQLLRRWHLQHWREQPAPNVARMLPELSIALHAYAAGAANDADVLDQLLMKDEDDNFSELQRVTALKPPEVVENCPPLRALIDRCRERIVEIELGRGEMPTAASQPALRIASLFGLSTLLRVWAALGSKAFSRPSYSYGQSRSDVLTHLIQVTHPSSGDTPELFAARVKEVGISTERLLQLAFLAPQWLKHVQHALGWQGLSEGVWWFLAHMPGGRKGLPDDDADEDVFLDEDEEDVQPVRQADPWERLLQERTALSQQERAEGAVDPNWFHRVHALLGKKRWQALAEAAKYGCSRQGHKKALAIAEVLLGRANKNDLIAGIRQRQLRDSVRLLGLLPLPKGDKRDKELLLRYKVIQEYRRYARGLSPMSRESAVRAGDIGLENLARTAGYADPIRLEWAMEAREVADLAAGALAVTHQGVTVTLALDEQAQPLMTVQRGDKILQNIPSEVRKHPKIALLADRRTELKRQASRVRLSLENAMCRGDSFSAAELQQLFEHPILVPPLERLILLGEGIAGFPTAKGKALVDHNGKIEPIKPNEGLRIAHPHDLLSGGEWHLWQKHLFQTERVQPFKQVFRELYVVTEQEKADGHVSHRYAGHQVNPNQAMALFGSRGWGTQDGVRKIFHDVGLVAEVSFRWGAFTPLELEGQTLDGIEFRKREQWNPMPLTDVPPRIFSEVMRDVDLVVSVAHLGGVDPEASASTVEMRAALLRETCALLKIDNFRVEKTHALIEGQLGSYSVHLGSAVVHRMPGGSLCIVPVHAQQRGRLFLPFADDDPRTAEVLSKVILLARDNEILDPSILEQIR